MILSMGDGGRVVANAMRSYGRKVNRSVHLQAYVCAGIAPTMTRPVALAFQHTLMYQHGSAYDVPRESVYPIGLNDIRSYAKEAARLVFDYVGIALCGSEMPILCCNAMHTSPAVRRTRLACSLLFQHRRGPAWLNSITLS